MNGIISINADEITCSGTITSDIIKANNLLEADTAETISGLWNFTTLPYSSVSAVNGTDFTNLNSVNSAISSSLTGYVSKTGTDTISRLKTFSTDVRINNTKNLIFGTTTGAVLNFTTGNMYIDNQTGGGIYFFVSGLPNTYVDSTGLNIESGKRLYFNGARCSIRDSGTQLIYDVPINDSHSYRTNNVEGLKISRDTNGGIITFSGGIVMREYTGFQWLLYDLPASNVVKYRVNSNDIFEISDGGAVLYESLSMRNGKSVIWNEGFTNIALIRKDSVNLYLEYEVATTYKHRFSVNSVEEFAVDVSGVVIPSDKIARFGITGSSIGYSTSLAEIQYKVPTANSHDFFVNNVAIATIETDGVIIQSTAVGAGIPAQKLYLNANKLNYIDASTTNIRYNCPTGGSHSFLQNGTLIGSFNSTLLNLNTNNASLQIGTSSPIQIKHDTATTALQYRTIGSYLHNFFINGTQHFQMNTSGVITNVGGYRAKNGVSGALDPVYVVISWDGSRSHIWINNTDLGGTAIASDYRLKENIKPARPVLDKLCSIPMIEFEYKDIGIWKKGKGINYGIIAHELQEAFPEYENLVSCEKDGLTCDGDIQPQSLTSAMNLLFMGSIQELNAKVETQKTQMEAMQKQIEDQQRQIDQLLVLFSSRMV
jgi:hypothetical protein